MERGELRSRRRRSGRRCRAAQSPRTTRPARLGGRKAAHGMSHSAFSDATLAVEEMVADGDSVAVRYTATGTYDGEFMGVEPTGTDVEIVGFEINWLADGRIVESWGLFDTFGVMQQLGVVDPPGE
ncbi:ester cyclase [Halostella sp. PRR32]|uniref:ester cyclase n=1 Tax=Halostella sp. PRR32 TaxID=3098147 RepID=UPI002B1E43C7|nr:ester cyclase [Halostella sp. PRR32]